MNMGKRCLCVLAFVGQLMWGESTEEATRQFQAIDKIAEQNINVLMGNNRNHLLTPLEMKRPLRQKFSWLAETLSKENPLNFLQQKLSSMSQAIFVDELKKNSRLQSSSAWYLFKLIKADLQTCLWQANFDDALVDNALLALLLQKSTGTSVTSDYWKTAEKEYREAAILVSHTIPGCFLTQYVPEPSATTLNQNVDLTNLWKKVMSPFADNQPDELKLENMSRTFVKYLKEAIEYRTEWIKNKCDDITLKNNKNVRIKNIKNISDIYNESCDNYKDGLKKQWDSVCSEASAWCLRDVQPSASSIAGQSNSCLIHAVNPNKLWSHCLNGAFFMRVPLRSKIFENYSKIVQEELDRQTKNCNKNLGDKKVRFNAGYMLSSDSSKFLAQALCSCPLVFDEDSYNILSSFSQKDIFSTVSINNPFGAAMLVRHGGSHYVTVVLTQKPKTIAEEISLAARGHCSEVNNVFCEKYWLSKEKSKIPLSESSKDWLTGVLSQIEPSDEIKKQLKSLYFTCSGCEANDMDCNNFNEIIKFIEDQSNSNLSVQIVGLDNIDGVEFSIKGVDMLTRWGFLKPQYIVEIDIGPSNTIVYNVESVNINRINNFSNFEAFAAFCEGLLCEIVKKETASFSVQFPDGTTVSTLAELSEAIEQCRALLTLQNSSK